MTEKRRRAMGWFTRGDRAPEPETFISTSVVFKPQPLDDDGWDDVVVKPGDDLPPYKAPAVGKPEAKAKAARRRKPAGIAKASTPPAARAEDDRRTPLQIQLAEITEKHKDDPIEEMIGPIREALVAHGRDVPDDWIVAIAEGLRRHGPTPLNLGGPSKRVT